MMLDGTNQKRRHKRSFSDNLLESEQTPPINYFDPFGVTNIFNIPLSPENLSTRHSLTKREEYQFPDTDHKSSTSSKIHQREQYINEINQDGDFLLQQCNSIIGSAYEDQEISGAQIKNEILQAISPQNIQNSVIETHSQRQTGTLKFFDEAKKYGFIIMDSDGSDIFVHQDDLNKAGLTKDFLRTAKHGNQIRLSFISLSYFGKYQKSRKAIDIQLISQNNQFVRAHFNKKSTPLSKHKRSKSNLETDDFKTPKGYKSTKQNPITSGTKIYHEPNQKEMYAFPDIEPSYRRNLDRDHYGYLTYQMANLAINQQAQ